MMPELSQPGRGGPTAPAAPPASPHPAGICSSATPRRGISSACHHGTVATVVPWGSVWDGVNLGLLRVRSGPPWQGGRAGGGSRSIQARRTCSPAPSSPPASAVTALLRDGARRSVACLESAGASPWCPAPPCRAFPGAGVSGMGVSQAHPPEVEGGGLQLCSSLGDPMSASPGWGRAGCGLAGARCRGCFPTPRGEEQRGLGQFWGKLWV